MALLDGISRRTGFNTSQLSARTEALDVDALLQSLSGSAGALLGSIMDTSASILSGLANAGIALVIAVYLLLSRRSLARKSKKLLYAYLAKPHADRVCHIAGLVQAAYTKFLSGQCIEACILGVLVFLAFSAFGLPYAGLIGFLTAISAFIPYVGAFVACVIGALLILLSSPEQALISVLVFWLCSSSKTSLSTPTSSAPRSAAAALHLPRRADRRQPVRPVRHDLLDPPCLGTLRPAARGRKPEGGGEGFHKNYN